MYRLRLGPSSSLRHWSTHTTTTTTIATLTPRHLWRRSHHNYQYTNSSTAVVTHRSSLWRTQGPPLRRQHTFATTPPSARVVVAAHEDLRSSSSGVSHNDGSTGPGHPDWERLFSAFLAYRARTGNEWVPKEATTTTDGSSNDHTNDANDSNDPDLDELRQWIEKQQTFCQRKYRAIRKNGGDDSRLRPHVKARLARLDAVHFVWHVRSYKHEQTWQTRFRELADYYQRYGHLTMPHNSDDNDGTLSPECARLSTWMSLQRAAYRERQRIREEQESSETSASRTTTTSSTTVTPRLTNEHIAQLETLNFNWNRNPKSQRRRPRKAGPGKPEWERLFAAYCAYREETGNECVPSRVETRITEDGNDQERQQHLDELRSWIRKERAFSQTSYAIIEKNGGDDTCLPAPDKARLQRLEEVNFVWQSNRNEMIWQTRFRELVNYYETHGHLRIPRDTVKLDRLARWTSLQRRAYQQRQRGTPPTKGRDVRRCLTDDHMAQLETLPFEWDVKSTRPSQWHVDFSTRYTELQAFRERHGHGIVPHPHTLNKHNKKDNIDENESSTPIALSKWALYIRTQYQLKEEGKRSVLTDEHVEALDKLDFCWRPKRIWLDERWMANWRTLKEYTEAHGQVVSVSTMGPEYNRLTHWISRQRQLYHEQQDGKEVNSLTEKRIALLNEIDFVWSIPTVRSLVEKEWPLNIERLRKFKEEHGHCIVPTVYDPDPALGKWAQYMRIRYQRSKGKGTESVTLQNIQELTAMGFEWRIKERYRELILRKRLKQLTDFYRKHGHTLVLHRENPSLWNWMVRQRKEYDRWLFKKPSSMTPALAKALDRLEMFWIPAYGENFLRQRREREKKWRALQQQREKTTPKRRRRDLTTKE